MLYAVNLCELMQFDAISPVRIVLGPLLTRETRACEGDLWDGDAILLNPELPEERIQTAIEIIRKRVPPSELRIYRGTGKAKKWERI